MGITLGTIETGSKVMLSATISHALNADKVKIQLYTWNNMLTQWELCTSPAMTMLNLWMAVSQSMMIFSDGEQMGLFMMLSIYLIKNSCKDVKKLQLPSTHNWLLLLANSLDEALTCT